MKGMIAVWKFLCSLKLAVVVLASLAVALAAATIIESLYDIKHGKYWVYQTLWFYGLLAFLGVNILCVALSRLPWRRRHIPFLTAHLGILILLFGSWVTYRSGTDASLRVTEGEAGSVLDIDETVLAIQYTEPGKPGAAPAERYRAIPIPWLPPTARFEPIFLQEHGLVVDQYLTHADSTVTFSEAGRDTPEAQIYPAVQLHLSMEAMGFSREFWLWGGDPQWQVSQVGPITFSIGEVAGQKSGLPASGTRLEITADARGRLSYRSFSQAQEGAASKAAAATAGLISSKEIEKGPVRIPTRWKGPMGDVVVRVKKWIPRAQNHSRYVASRTQYGDRAPPPAIHLSLLDSQGRPDPKQGVWLGLGERVELLGERKVTAAFRNRGLLLPFSIQLERFQIEHYEGTRNPASYSSKVRILDSGAPEGVITVSMNEPLDWKGYTFYQSSYEPAEPRPVTSIFSVNRDPGRWLKYIGSLLIVIGSISLFVVKVIQARKLNRSKVGPFARVG